MPAIRALAIVLTAWILVLLAPPGPASAGGPTSALLSVPGEGRTASLYFTDSEYEQLAGLVDVGASSTVDESGADHVAWPSVTVTWLVHDVEPWRVDRIYLGGEHGPWIATQEVLGDSTPIWDSPVTWHQPTGGKELTQLLNSLGVGQIGQAAQPATQVESGAPAPESVEPAAAAPTATDTSDTSARDRAWWGLGGLAGGVLLAAGWMRVRSMRHRDRAEGGGNPHPDLDPTTEWISVGR